MPRIRPLALLAAVTGFGALACASAAPAATVAQPGVATAVREYGGTITVVEGNALGRLIGTVFDFMIKAVDGLLMMSVVVALIGIINTLSLSILERRRELGLLRVVGMTDKRVQRMVRLESLVIAGLGTLVGLAVGLFAAWALILSISRLSDADISPGFPVGSIALILVLGVALGLLASLVPSRRSTRLDVLEALEAT